MAARGWYRRMSGRRQRPAPPDHRSLVVTRFALLAVISAFVDLLLIVRKAACAAGGAARTGGEPGWRPYVAPLEPRSPGPEPPSRSGPRASARPCRRCSLGARES